MSTTQSSGSQEHAKRPRSIADPKQKEGGSPTVSDFKSLLEESNKEMAANILKAVNENVTESMSKFNKFFTDKFNLFENRVTQVENDNTSFKNDLRETIESLKQSQEEVEKQLRTIQDQFDIRKEPTYVAPPVDERFERPARKDVLTIGAADHIAKAKLQVVVLGLIDA